MNTVTALAQLDAVYAQSQHKPMFLYKYSTRCEVCAEHALPQIEAYAKTLHSVPICAVRVIEERSISDEITSRTGIAHQSPQLLLLLHGKVIWHASHKRITLAAMYEAVQHALLLFPSTVLETK